MTTRSHKQDLARTLQSCTTLSYAQALSRVRRLFDKGALPTPLHLHKGEALQVLLTHVLEHPTYDLTPGRNALIEAQVYDSTSFGEQYLLGWSAKKLWIVRENTDNQYASDGDTVVIRGKILESDEDSARVELFSKTDQYSAVFPLDYIAATEYFDPTFKHGMTYCDALDYSRRWLYLPEPSHPPFLDMSKPNLPPRTRAELPTYIEPSGYLSDY